MTAPVSNREVSAFPVRWDDPADAERTFTIDLMHTPKPVCPLAQSTRDKTLAYGISAAAAELNLPIGKSEVRYLNYYQFEWHPPVDPGSPEEAQARAKAAEEAMRREAGRLGERWRDEHLPRVEELVRRMEEIESAIAAASTTDVAAMMDELMALARELWTIHFRVAFPMVLALQAFDELYADLFDGDPADGHALLVGRPSMSVQAGIGLFDLATEARRAGVDRLILETPLEEIVPRLRETPDGQAYVAKLEEYLHTFGLRQDLFDITIPTWRENPTIALASVRAYLQNGHDPRAAHAANVRAADAAVETARAQLASYPVPVRDQFEAMLQSARDAAFLQEEHNFHIDQNFVGWARLIFLQIGHRLVELGAIGAADDVFLLRFEEIQRLLTIAIDEQTARATREQVTERRAGMEWARSLTPPLYLGPPPEARPNNVFGRANARFFGGPPQVADAPDQLKGAAGSRGVATGPAFVARSLEEAKAIKSGQILVATTTMPAWSPFFGVAAAVVTETGGPLSHCAIVAREYGIPAVVGAHGAMRAISTGQVITVDGNRGIVTLAAPPA